jgi:hypothetical protein
MLREIIVPDTNQYVIQIPDEYLHKRIEILILPFNNELCKIKKREIRLTTFKCGGKLRDFTREDAYRENFY